MARRNNNLFLIIAVGVLVVFFFLLITAGAFYFGIQKKSVEDESLRAADMLGLQTSLRVMFLPELECSFLGTHKDNCIDVFKLSVFRDLLEDDDVREDYFSGFGFSTIKVRQAWPCTPDSVRCGGVVLYNNSLPGRDFSYVASSQSPVLLLDPYRDEYFFGVVEVDVYVP